MSGETEPEYPGPQTRREAAMRILLGELGDLFKRVDALALVLQGLTARLDSVKAAMPDPTVTTRPEPKRRVSFGPVVAGFVAGLIGAGAAFAADSLVIQQTREEARIGRAVMAAFPSLDEPTREKLQSAINQAAHAAH